MIDIIIISIITIITIVIIITIIVKSLLLSDHYQHIGYHD